MDRATIERIERRAVSFEKFLCTDALRDKVDWQLTSLLPRITGEFKAEIEDERDYAFEEAARLIDTSTPEGVELAAKIGALKSDEESNRVYRCRPQDGFRTY